jgi:hypothetical protein
LTYFQSSFHIDVASILSFTTNHNVVLISRIVPFNRHIDACPPVFLVLVKYISISFKGRNEEFDVLKDAYLQTLGFAFEQHDEPLVKIVSLSCVKNYQ